MNTNLRSKLIASLCLGYAIASVCTTAAAAEEPVPSEVVRYADLNIANPAGALALYHRIQAAARRVCQLNGAADTRFKGVEPACYKRAVDEAVNRVDSAALSRIHGVTLPRLANR